jgi:predicted DNA-binding protein
VCIVSDKLDHTPREKEVREVAATKTVTIRLPVEDYETLERLSERGHSYPATVARRLLSDILEEKRREMSDAESV